MYEVLKNYKGLTDKEVEKKRKKYGFNELTKENNSLLKKLINSLLNPISLMLILASFLSYISNKMIDFYFIIVLFLINIGISSWQEFKADKAIEKLSRNLEVNTKVYRNGKWVKLNSRDLVPGDIIELIVGDIIPADLKIISGKNISLNESSLNGESLPKEKKSGDTAFSGSFVSSGWLQGIVSEIGNNTYFGKTLVSVEKVRKKSLLEKDILKISKFLMVISLVCVTILTGVFIFSDSPLIEIMILDLSLLIAGIPVAMPVVMSLILSMGVLSLSKKNVIVRRMSSLEDLANVTLLLTDKTGTMTINEIQVNDVIPYSGYKKEEVLEYASLSANQEEGGSIDKAILNKFKFINNKLNVTDFIPADSERKRSTTFFEQNKTKAVLSIGAPQVIENLCKINFLTKKKFNKEISICAKKGLRTVAVALKINSNEESEMKLIGLITLSDPLRKDAKQTISFLRKNNIDIKMLTGDNYEISQTIAYQLGLKGFVINKSSLSLDKINDTQLRNIAAFSEILPKDKYDLVQKYQNLNLVAVTGDGINDLPAMKGANVSIAVSNSVDALKSSADIVLMNPGISVIKDALIESRKIFSRLYSYSIYRISESFRIILAIFILGLIIKGFPLTPIQILLLVFLNDLPIISLAFNRVKNTTSPGKIEVKKRFILSSLFGLTGLINSLLFFFITYSILKFPISDIQTMFFLKLTISGHLLIYVAHTKDKWYKYLPSKSVIFITTTTQLIASLIALLGLFMNKISLSIVLLIWAWSFLWMQVSEFMKYFQRKIIQ